MGMARFDTVETPENNEVKPPEVIEDTGSIKSGDGDGGIDSEIDNSVKMGEDDTSNEMPNETKDALEDSEVTENPYADGMSEEDKEAYGISSEIEDFVKTGQMDEVKLPSEMQEEAADALEDSEVTENPYADGMSEEDKEAYGISSEIEDFVKTGQMDEVKLPSEMQEDGADVSEGGDSDSEIEKTIVGTDENDNDNLTLMDKVKFVSAAVLTGLSIRADQEAYAQDISNLTRDNTIERVEAPPEDYSGMAENFRDAASEILKKREDEDGDAEGLDGGKEISSDVGGYEKIMEMNTSFEQDGPTLQETWNTDVDNVAYDQNDDE